MNNDLISRAALQAVFENECVGECGCCKHIKHNPEGCDLIDNAPAVDAEPMRCGGWEITPTSNGFRMQYVGDDKNRRQNCGAKMDGQEEPASNV